jgi:hypothetical protein
LHRTREGCRLARNEPDSARSLCELLMTAQSFTTTMGSFRKIRGTVRSAVTVGDSSGRSARISLSALARRRHALSQTSVFGELSRAASSVEPSERRPSSTPGNVTREARNLNRARFAMLPWNTRSIPSRTHFACCCLGNRTSFATDSCMLPGHCEQDTSTMGSFRKNSRPLPGRHNLRTTDYRPLATDQGRLTTVKSNIMRSAYRRVESFPVFLIEAIGKIVGIC